MEQEQIIPRVYINNGPGDTAVLVAGTIQIEQTFKLLDVDKPYLINTSQIECVVGEWNKDKTIYGVRVFFASGNSVWCGGDSARDILRRLWGVEATKKFDEASKR